jgi:hypothetical protein
LEKTSNDMKREAGKEEKKSDLRRGRHENESEERDEMGLYSIDQKKMNKEIWKKEYGKISQTGERGETTRWNQSQSFVVDCNGMKREGD